MNKTFLSGCLAVALIGSLSACSSPPKPKAEIAMSQQALQSAEISGARQYAPIELRTAREKRELAQAEMRKEEYGKAKRLSEQAVVDADLARAKATAEKSRLALKEVQNSVHLMRSEIDRARDH
jgi:hypothetical protein